MLILMQIYISFPGSVHILRYQTQKQELKEDNQVHNTLQKGGSTNG